MPLRIALAGLLAAGLALGAGAASSLVFEGEAVITETTVWDSAIGDPVAFSFVIDLSQPEPSGRTLTVYADAPGNGLRAVSWHGGAVAHDVACDAVAAGVWNDDSTQHDAISLAATGCHDAAAMTPVLGATMELEDVLETALAEPLFPEPLVLESFLDRRELTVFYSETILLRAQITQIPEPGWTASARATLFGIGIACARPARARTRNRR